MRLPFRKKEPDPYSLGPRPSKTGAPKNAGYLSEHPDAEPNPDKAERMARTEMGFRSRIVRAGKMAEVLSEEDDATRGYLLGLVDSPIILPRDESGWTPRDYLNDILRLKAEAPAAIERVGSSYDACVGAARLVMAEIGTQQKIEAAENYKVELDAEARERAGRVGPEELKRAIGDALGGGLHAVSNSESTDPEAAGLAA